MIFDLEREEAVVGTVVSNPKAMPAILETGLTAEHFYCDPFRAAFRSMLRFHDQGIPWDHLAIKKDCGFDVEYTAISATWQCVPHARELVDMAQWRHRQQMSEAMAVACEARNEEMFAKIESDLLYGFQRADEVTFSTEDLGNQLWNHLEISPEAFEFPFWKLTDLASGGMRRGEVTLLGGWSSHGKSALLDQILGHATRQGHVCHLYINEMTPRTRSLRWVAREAQVNLKALMRGQLSDNDKAKCVEKLGQVPYPITDAAGWSAEQIARHMRRLKADVVGIDILHLIPHDDEGDLKNISQVLNIAAKLAHCHVIATVHLNEKRVMGQTRPMPTLGDIRGSGMLKNDADNVLFVFREQDADTGYPQEPSRAYFAKSRMGECGGIELSFSGNRTEFEEVSPGWG